LLFFLHDFSMLFKLDDSLIVFNLLSWRQIALPK
jgi:hypothetical protein